ncbi:MAG: tail fiber protein [Phycisphaerales bacterium]
MATNTPNYDLIKPAVNDPADQDLWGTYWNENADILDSTIKAVSDDADAALAAVTGLVPAGVIVPYAVATAPTGWLACGGQAVSRTTYAALFTAIGTTFGSGDSSTTFNLPDLRGRVVAGLNTLGGSDANRLTVAGCGIEGDNLGAAGGTETHTLVTNEIPAHTHNFTVGGNAAGGNRTAIQGAATIEGANPASAPIQNAGGGLAHNNTQPTIVLNYIIKT